MHWLAKCNIASIFFLFLIITFAHLQRDFTVIVSKRILKVCTIELCSRRQSCLERYLYCVVQKAILELRGYISPPPVINDVLKATLLLLGEHEDRLQVKHMRNNNFYPALSVVK